MSEKNAFCVEGCLSCMLLLPHTGHLNFNSTKTLEISEDDSLAVQENFAQTVILVMMPVHQAMGPH
jgi:hypothetical protein